MGHRNELLKIYAALLARFGHRGWWPDAETPFEVCHKPVFVVDACTKRILVRYGMIGPGAGYDDIQAFFTNNPPADVALYNDFHAQIVHLGNAVCKTAPGCDQCPVCRMCGRRRG